MINSRDITLLHPTIQRGIIELKKRTGLNFGISSGYRDVEYQNMLYQKGRTTPGKKVTNAVGGRSMHNYKVAFDIFKNVKGDEYNSEFLRQVGLTWISMGGDWGGSWTSFVDTPHLEFTGGYDIKDFRNGVILPLDSKMQWESDEVEKRYQTVEELPIWARVTIETMIKNGKINKGNLDLSLDMVRILCIMNR